MGQKCHRLNDKVEGFITGGTLSREVTEVANRQLLARLRLLTSNDAQEWMYCSKIGKWFVGTDAPPYPFSQ